MAEKKPSPRSRTKSSAAPSKAGEAPAPARRAPARAAARGPAASDALDLLAQADTGRFPPTLYVDGPDESLKAAFLAAFRRAWAAHCAEAPAARVMRPGEDGVDGILSAYHGVSMFTPRELILVLDVEDLGRSEKRVAALAEGAARPAGESCLVLVESAAESPRKTIAPLRAACAKAWTAMPLDRRGLLAWGTRTLAADGLEAEAGALDALATACEGDTLAFFNELGKLSAWVGETRRVTRADVEALMHTAIGAGVAGYLAAVALGRAEIAARKLGRLLAEGESEGGILFNLGNLVSGALGGWARHRDASATLARRAGERDLAKALDAVYRAESAWKSGRVDALTALEQATREVAR